MLATPALGRAEAPPLSPDTTVSSLGGSGPWSRVSIPEARCGDGSPYSVFVRAGRSDRVALELSGGGACWDLASCYGSLPFTFLSVRPPGDRSGITSRDPARSPLADATYIWLPYCTGDVHAGEHVALYAGHQVAHVGSMNVRASLSRLDESLGILRDAREVYVVGRSAGAIGLLLHLPWIDAQLVPSARRTAVVDSPGLHFGRNFWNKFSNSYFDDVRRHMQDLGMVVSRGQGMIADQLPALCERYSNWKIGFLQSNGDIAMSLIFGAITPHLHALRVLGDDGLAHLVRQQFGQCYAWVHRSSVHTFTGTDTGMAEETRGISAWRFVSSVIGQGPGLSILP